jgi:hypothetical protein
MNPITALILLSIISAVICYYVASQRGAKTSFWVLMALLFGPFAIPFVFFAKPRF